MVLVLDGYREIAVLAEGPRFRLARAENADGSRVLVKTLVGAPAETATDRLEHELALERGIRHPAIVEPIELLPDGRQPALVLPDDGGRTLRQVIDAGNLPVRRALHLAAGIAAGIVELHRHDIVHRAIEPANVMVSEDGAAAQIIDLGAATVVPRQQAALLAGDATRGSLPYTSPEQTGRTSRPVDYRTDLYSLGVTLFEMLTGRTPFTSTEPLELIHDHLAAPPPRPSDLAVGVPAVVDALVSRLLEKDPGDRYRSALGVLRDLEQIRDYIVRGLDPEELELAGVEISTKFQLPDQLFGRTAETAALEAWLQRAAAGRASLLLVHGQSGVGKSALIEELRRPVNEQRGHLAVGKADQAYNGPADTPLAAALSDLVRQLLSEEDDHLDMVRRRVRRALGEESAILAEAVPELRLLLRGTDPARPGTIHDATRLSRVAGRFLSAVATPDHPVVLVLDDLQWADQTTIDFAVDTAATGGTEALLVVAAYRDDDIAASPSLQTLQTRLAEEGADFGDITLRPLSRTAVGDLVAAAVGRTAVDAAPLAELCHRIAAGNPLHIRLFLSSLYERGLLEVDAASGAWSWDVEEVTSLVPADELVDLTTGKIEALHGSTRTLIGVMAVVGSQGDAKLLEEIGLSAVVEDLRGLAAQDLIELTDDPPRVRWRFAHDRIRNAAENILDEETAASWHGRIGAALQRRFTGYLDAETSVFAVVRHLNAAFQPTAGGDATLAALNLEAGRRAVRTSDYEAALRYFAQGAGVLGPDQWEEHPQTAFALHLAAADAARLLTRYDEMDRWVEPILASTVDRDQLFEATLRKIYSLSQVGRHHDALEVTRQALAMEGWTLPVRPRRRAIVLRSLGTRLKIGTLPIRWSLLRPSVSTWNSDELRRQTAVRAEEARRPSGWRAPESQRDSLLSRAPGVDQPASIHDLLELPQIRDRSARNIVRLISEGAVSAYSTDRNLLRLMILEGINLCIAHGSHAAAALIYAFFGALVCVDYAAPDTGLAYADTAVGLTRTMGTLSRPSRVRLIRDVFVAPANVPLAEIEPSLERAHHRGLSGGDAAFGTAALFFTSLHRFLAGRPLADVRRPLDVAAAELQRHGQQRNLTAALALRQLLHDLTSGPSNGVPLSGPHLDGEAHLRNADPSADGATSLVILTLRAISRWHLGDDAGARLDIAAGRTHVDAVLGQAIVPVYHLYGVLAAAPVGAPAPAAVRRRARTHRRRLAWFAKHNPAQHLPLLALADGAIAASRGRAERARRHLTAAMQLTAEQPAPMATAIAESLLAQIAERDDDRRTAVRHRTAAAAAYRAWGASALAGAGTGAAPHGDDGADDATLDLTTVVRASEAISEQIELASLLRRLVQVMLQSAGAERAVLFRVDGDRVVAEAEGDVDRTDAQIRVRVLDEDADPPVAHSVVRLVARTTEHVLIARAQDDALIRHDPSVGERGVRSLLCIPLVTQGHLEGILYLENNQVDGAFTSDRIRLLRILSSQAASALEKARLHDSQRRLIAAQDRFVPAQFISALGHTNLVEVERGQGILKVVDILFTDIRSFTSLLERMSPSEAMAFVNDYLAHMEPVVHDHDGFIDSYEGDSILALFDAGTDAGVRAAVAMAQAERRDNARRRAEGRQEIHTGFGLNTAGVMMGIVGGATALRATIIGDAVNVASRIQNLTKRYATTLLISENTAVRMRPDTALTLRPLERVQLVGKTQAMQMFEVLEALDPEAQGRRIGSLPRYMEAIVAFERGALAEAHLRFSDLAQQDPTDVPVAVMLRRSEELLQSGAELGGPPITRLRTK